MNCRQLQVLLGLQNWTITCTLVDSLPKKGKANICYDVLKTNADIKISKAVSEDHLQSLLHELIHASLAWMDPLMKKNPLANLLLEQTVNSLSVAFVNLIVAAKQQIPKESVSSGPEA